jgi:hypothetical protein
VNGRPEDASPSVGFFYSLLRRKAACADKLLKSKGLPSSGMQYAIPRMTDAISLFEAANNRRETAEGLAGHRGDKRMLA